MAVKKRIEAAASRTPLAERIVQQRRAEPDISLERLEAELAEASRYDIVAALKELEKVGVGQLLTGRKGQKSRFVWGEKGAAAKKPVGKKAEASASFGSAEPQAKATARKAAPAGKRLERPKPTVAAAVPPAAVSLPVAQPARGSRTLKHAFHLRPGVQVAIDLPEDVTLTEVERFCSFLKAIPFAAQPRR